MTRLTYDKDNFLLDGKKYTVLSGAMHYFRVPREYWYDRLLKLKECGFNTVETYTCWNLHEKNEGNFDFSGGLDVAAYIETAAELGLNVIVRPGPYICAEWDFGGLPAWLLKYEDMPLRCSDKRFMSKFEAYLRELLSRISRFDNIIMLQIENEYGSYGNDKVYLNEIKRIYEDCGMDCLYFTSDGPTELMLSGGTLDGCLAVANFGSKPKQNLSYLKKIRPDQPLMCGEYWCGWFDHWFENHHVRTADEICGDFGEFFELGASVNFYMFHGGTNFGFTNGANCDECYQPIITSYDYNALLTEAGDRTEAYYRVREMIAEKTGVRMPLTAKESDKKAYGTVVLNEKADLFENLDKISKPVSCAAPMFMESVGQSFGYMVYRADVRGSENPRKLVIEKVHDRANIFIDGKPVGIYDRRCPPASDKLVTVGGESDRDVRLDILVENMGRTNYGPKLRDRKGISGVRFDYQYHFGWKQYPLDMEDLSELEFVPHNGEKLEKPTFLRGYLCIDDTPCDCFVRLDGFTKGFVSVNGNNIGRYYNPAGPQKTLYIPAPFLRKGKNEIIVFESDEAATDRVEIGDIPDLG